MQKNETLNLLLKKFNLCKLNNSSKTMDRKVIITSLGQVKTKKRRKIKVLKLKFLQILNLLVILMKIYKNLAQLRIPNN
jgi:hypothetical protein